MTPPKDPLRGAPPPGRWVLWHGPQAQAVVDLAHRIGQVLPLPSREDLGPILRQCRPWPQVELALPPLPGHYPDPCSLLEGAWLLLERYLVISNAHEGGRSCYLVEIMQADREQQPGGSQALGSATQPCSRSPLAELRIRPQRKGVA